MVLCGISIAGFTLSVFLDVVTRELGSAWLWLQLVTTGFFAWGVFIGMATATRRIDHLNLVEITKRMSGPKRSFLEITNRVIILLVGLAMVVFGFQNFLNDLGSFRAPSLIPLATYTASVPIAGVADRAVFDRADRQWLAPRLRGAGRRGRFRGHREMSNGADPAAHDGPVPGLRLHGRSGRLRADGRRAGRLQPDADQHAIDDRPDVPRHRFGDPAGGSVLPPGRRADDVGGRHQPHDPAGADHGRALARRPGAGRHPVQHVLCRHLRLVHGGRRGAEPHRGARDDQGGLRPRLHGGADRLRLHHGEPHSAEHHGGRLWRDRQRLDRRAVPGRHRAGRADRHRPDDLLAFLRARPASASRAPRCANSPTPRAPRCCP